MHLSCHRRVTLSDCVPRAGLLALRDDSRTQGQTERVLPWSGSEMLRSQSSSASLRVAESAAFQSRPNRPFWAPFSAQGSIPTATRGCTVHMVPRACAKAAAPGETAGGWSETAEVSMISSSPPAHASTRETHLRRCSSHPPLQL